MKTFALVLAFATFYAASVDGGLVTRQAEKGRRIVRIRGRQREDRQLFLEPVPLTLNQPVVIPAPIGQPFIQPIPQPILQRVVQPVAQPLVQPVVQQVQQPVELVEVREVQAEEPRQAAQGYGAPPREAEVEAEAEAEEARQAPQAYGAPATEASVSYGAPPPAEAVVVEVRAEPSPSYLAPEPLTAGSAVLEVRQQPAQFSVPQTVAAEGLVRLKPIAITRSVYNAPGAQPGNDNWNYAFESENGIKQQALGEMRSIDNSDVLVMRGSYEYIGADALTYVVNWEADENGFRASAPHLPQPVAIPFPEQQAAVDAQIRFAAEEDALRLRSGTLPAYEN